MCPFVEKKKEKSVVFSLTYKYQGTTYSIFSTPSNATATPIIPTPAPSYYSGLKSTCFSLINVLFTFVGRVLVDTVFLM